MIKVSVIVPVYNGAVYLRECLDSILQQTMEETEIVCIDDASTDMTPVILQEYEGKWNNIKVITNPINRGAGITRNIGMQSVNGKYVIFLDADDVFEKNMLQEAFSRAERFSADICTFCEDELTDNTKEYSRYPYPHALWENLEARGVFSSTDVKDVVFNIWNGWPWDKLFNREFLIKNELQFQEIRSSEDGLFVHGALAVAERITCINKIFVHHRVNINTSLSNMRDASWECCYLYLRELKKYLIEHNRYSDCEKSFVNWASDFLYWNYCTLNEKNRANLYNVLKEYLFEEFGLLRSGQEKFYNAFYYWFIQEVYNSRNCKCCKVPVDETGRWIWMLRKNRTKIDKMFQYLSDHRYYAALWGAGKRGKAFLNEYGDREEIKKVYDQDTKISGIRFGTRYLIELFDHETCKEIDFVIVTNKLYFSNIANIIKNINPQIKVFNLEAYQEPYLSYPVSLEECIS